ncbi:MAG: outer envelope protein [Proteobacteria bacterium]|nr:outer envelope protein [Pseudomonadota bacterium]
MKFSQKTILAASVLAACAGTAGAAEWSDTSIGYRYGTKFAEPFESNSINKSIVNLTHASGYKYGTNFFNADLLMADSKDPAAPGSKSGSQEIYIVYRHTLDLGKITGQNFKFGPVRGLGLTGGFDVNTKNDAGYNSRKRMVVAGPTLMMDVPGFLNVSLLYLWESNAPYSKFSGTQTERYSYDVHPMLTAAWGIPFNLGPVPLSFEGFANFIASKGQNEFGGGTKPETNIDMQVMYDVSPHIGAAKNTFKAGLEYQYWRNKFGNDHTKAAGDGAFAKTPMVRVEYHF